MIKTLFLAAAVAFTTVPAQAVPQLPPCVKVSHDVVGRVQSSPGSLTYAPVYSCRIDINE